MYGGMPSLQVGSQPRGEIRGTVTITTANAAVEIQKGHVMLDRYGTDPAAAGSAPVKRDSRPYKISESVAVYLVSNELSQETYVAPSQHSTLDQKGLKFHPQVLPILAGTTVDFPNEDNLFHNVFSYSRPGEFDLGRYPMGDSRSVTFEHPGVVRVYCDIHSDMNATILVLDNPYFATPGDDGTFVISNIPEGKYTLNMWYARDLVLHRSITIGPADTVKLDLVY
jgi:plastocyanin